MAFTIFLLGSSLGCAEVSPPNQSTPDGTDRTQDSNGTRIADAVGSMDEEAPPTTRPERGPSALGPDNSSEDIIANGAVRGVVELLRAGVDEEVLLKHIQNSPESFGIGSESIVFLTDLGAPGHVISAMMDRDAEIQSGQASLPLEPSAREPWPAMGTVAEVAPTAEASSASATLPLEVAEASLTDTPAQEISVDYFQDYLGPYGTWIEVPEYGLCWQPTVAISAPGWKPYGDRGRWVYTDFGWYWYSDYSWGWAAFHYGRWFHHTQWGWCWAPGTVWGPSWVSWRYSAPYCGWAPLPPYSRSGFYFSVGISWGIPSWCYTYVPSYRICTYYPRKHAVPYAKARYIHGKSRIRNHYAVGRNHTIENRGIPPRELTDNSERDIRRAQVRKRQEAPAGSGRRERLDADSQILTVYEPEQSNRRVASPPPAGRRTRDGGITSSPERGGAPDTNGRRSSPSEPTIANTVRDTTPAENGRGEPRSSRSFAPRHAGTVLTGESATTVDRRSEPPARARSIQQPTGTNPRTPTRVSTGTRRQGTAATSARTDSSLIIMGRRETQQTPISPKRSQTRTLERTAPTTRSPSIANTQVRGNSRISPQSSRTWNVPSTRTQPTRPTVSAPARTPQPRTVTRIAPPTSTRTGMRQNPAASSLPRPMTSAPQYRAQPSRSANISSAPRRSAPARTPVRSITPPSASKRSTVPVRPTPSVNAAPRRAPTYTPPPSTPRTAPSNPRSAPRSAPPGRSGDRPGSRSR